MEDNNPLAEPYFTEKEREWIRGTFKNNTFALKTLRKFFLPAFTHDDPIGQVEDMWSKLGTSLGQMHPQDREITILAYTRMMEHLRGKLAELQIIAITEEDAEAVTTEKERKGSSK